VIRLLALDELKIALRYDFLLIAGLVATLGAPGRRYIGNCRRVDYPWTMIETEILFHHFDDSPFSEKVRLAFGLKGLAWRSVRVSPILPRPDLMPLTGGYRRTPTMQIGADIYCDTAIILREIEARWPDPPLWPKGFAGLVSMLGLWSDRTFFQNTVNLVFGSLGDRVPQAFIEDRQKLRGGKFDIPAMKAAVPQMRDQFRAHADWIETQLEGHAEGLLGAYSLADIHAYMNVWYVLRRFEDGAKLLAEFPRLRDWAERLRAIGHGERTEISSANALAIAVAATPKTPTLADPADPNGLEPGDFVSVTPDDYGRIAVSGKIVSLSAQHIAIRRRDEIAGEIVVHFPRAGFLVVKD
jgi:glutathione S-transferase